MCGKHVNVTRKEGSIRYKKHFFQVCAASTGCGRYPALNQKVVSTPNAAHKLLFASLAAMACNSCRRERSPAPG